MLNDKLEISKAPWRFYLAPSGVWRILDFIKGRAKCSLATSAHTKGGKTKFSNFFYLVKKNFWTKGGQGRFG